MQAPGRVALDSSGAIAILRGDAAARAASVDLELLGLPAIALGELCYGAERALRSSEEHAAVSRLVSPVFCFPSVLGLPLNTVASRPLWRGRGHRSPKMTFGLPQQLSTMTWFC